MSNKEIGTLTIKGISHNLMDTSARKMISKLIDDNKSISATLDTYKQGILEMAQNLNTINSDKNIARKTSLNINDIDDTSPIFLVFNGNFSIYLDIVIVYDDIMNTYQGMLKCYDGHNKLSIINNDMDIGIYAKGVSNGNVYIQCRYNSAKKYNLYMNVVNIDGSVPNVVVNNGDIRTDDMIRL